MRELKQLVDQLHEQARVNAETVGQRSEATNDNSWNTRKTQEASEISQ